jgi:hypothetical protein
VSGQLHAPALSELDSVDTDFNSNLYLLYPGLVESFDTLDISYSQSIINQTLTFPPREAPTVTDSHIYSHLRKRRQRDLLECGVTAHRI